MKSGARFSGNSSGAVAAEMALILPGIAFIILNVVDLSMYVYAKMQVDLAAHEAVGAARVLCNTAAKLPAIPTCGTTLVSTMTAAAQTTSLGNLVTLSAPIENFYCARATGDLGPPVAQSSNCVAVVSLSTATPGDYISTTASYTFTPVFPGASIASALTSPIQRTSWMRLK